MTKEQKEDIKAILKGFRKEIIISIIGIFVALFFFTNIFGNNTITPSEMSTELENGLDNTDMLELDINILQHGITRERALISSAQFIRLSYNFGVI